jgi:hypothetical protein
MTWRAFIQLLVSLLGLAGVQADDLPPVAHGVSRREFLKALGMSAAALAALPEVLALDQLLDLDDALPGSFDLQQFDSIFKELYAPAIVEMLNADNPLLEFMDRELPASGVIPVRVGRNIYTGG